MRVTLVVILLSTQSLVRAVAQSTTDPGSKESASKLERPRIELEFDRDYSVEDLERLFVKDSTDDSKIVKINDEITAKIDVPGNLVSDSTSTSLIQKPRPRAKPKSVYLEQAGKLKYYATCPTGGYTPAEFKVNVVYNGKNVFYYGKQNIDKFGVINVGGGLGFPLRSTAEYHHSVCLAITPWLVCSYHHFGTLTARIVLGSHPGIEVGAKQAGDLPAEQAPYVVEACARVKKITPPTRCPPASVEPKACVMHKILY